MTALCILGTHRSGTSTISRAFNLLGFYLGEDKDVINSALENPKGFWELFDLMCVHQETLNRLGFDWDTTEPVLVDFLKSSIVLEQRQKLKELVTSRLAIHQQWMWKDPRTCLLLPLWYDLLREIKAELKVVFVVRNPLDVARSLNKRNGFSLEKGYRIWLLNNICALTNICGQNTAFISYEKFITNWEYEMKRALNILKIDWPINDAHIKNELADFIEPDLQHSKSTTSALSHAPDNVKLLFAHLLDRTSSADSTYYMPDSMRVITMSEGWEIGR